MYNGMVSQLSAHLPQALALKSAAADIMAGVFMFGDPFPDYRIFYLIAATSSTSDGEAQ